MFILEDVCCYVEIWNMNHAFKILDILSQVFGDICEIDENFFNDQSQYDVDCELEDEFSEQWSDLLNDDSLFELAIENLSLSQLEASTCAEVSCELHDESGKCDVPAAALDTLENFSVLE